MEQIVSTMETALISAQNAAALLVHDLRSFGKLPHLYAKEQVIDFVLENLAAKVHDEL